MGLPPQWKEKISSSVVLIIDVACGRRKNHLRYEGFWWDGISSRGLVAYPIAVTPQQKIGFGKQVPDLSAHNIPPMLFLHWSAKTLYNGIRRDLWAEFFPFYAPQFCTLTCSVSEGKIQQNSVWLPLCFLTSSSCWFQSMMPSRYESVQFLNSYLVFYLRVLSQSILKY